jgi:O-antigen ligase
VASSEQFVGVAYVLVQGELYLLFWIVVNAAKSEARFGKILSMLLVCLAAQAVVYFLQVGLHVEFTATGQVEQLDHMPRAGGTVATAPHGFANFILPPLFIAVAQLLTNKSLKNPQRWFTILAALLGLVALVLTLTRAAWGAFALGLAWIAFLGFRRGVVSMRKLVALGFAVVLIVAIATPLIIVRLTSAPLDKSYGERVALMRMAVQVIKSHPLLGVGPGAYAHEYKAYLTQDLAKRWQSSVHNHYLLRTAETGIVGGFAFIALLLVAFAQSLRLSRSPNPMIRNFGLAAGATIIGSAFDMYWDMWTFFTTQSMFWLILALILVARMLDTQALRTASPMAPYVTSTTPLRIRSSGKSDADPATEALEWHTL